MASVDELLAEARAALGIRPGPREAVRAAAAGALLVDIRSDLQRAVDGTLDSAIHIARNVLEWRADPVSPHHDPRLGGVEGQIILFCDEGYASSLAAASLRSLGLDATDLAGGFQAWRSEGLPVSSSRDIG